MFERFTTQARATVALAEEEARAAGHAAVGTEHILLGLLHAPDKITARVLASLHVDLTEARDVVGRALGWAEPTVGQIPFTPAAQRALALAPEEAVRRGRSEVEPEDILLALVAEPLSGAAQTLVQLGTTPGAVGHELELVAADFADPHRPGLEQLVAEDGLELGWRGRGIALAALGAAVLSRRAFDAGRTGPLVELEMQLLLYLALALDADADQASSASEGEAVDSIPAALACRRQDLGMAIEGLRREQLVVRPVDSDDDRVAITPAGVDRVERWLGRTASLFGGWPPEHLDVDDATG